MHKQAKGSILLLLCAMIWGAAFVAQSESMQYIGPFTMGAARFFLAGLVLLPVIAFFVLRLFLKDELMLGVAVVTLCMPVATSTAILSYECHADSQTASAGVFLTTLLSVVSVPAMMLLLFGK